MIDGRKLILLALVESGGAAGLREIILRVNRNSPPSRPRIVTERIEAELNGMKSASPPLVTENSRDKVWTITGAGREFLAG